MEDIKMKDLGALIVGVHVRLYEKRATHDRMVYRGFATYVPEKYMDRTVGQIEVNASKGLNVFLERGTAR